MSVDAKIQTYLSNTPGNVPLATAMEEGQLAVNAADKKLFVKAAGAIVELSQDLSSYIGVGNFTNLSADVITEGGISLVNKYLGINSVPAAHDHNIVYYTKAEIDTALIAAVTSGTVDTSGFVNISDLDAYAALAGATFTGNIYAPLFQITSARAAKEDIVPTDVNAIELLKTVDVVNFVFKYDETKTPRVGFIADDTNPILSGVNQDNMDIGNVLGVLMKAVQELTKEVEILKAGQTPLI